MRLNKTGRLEQSSADGPHEFQKPVMRLEGLTNERYTSWIDNKQWSWNSTRRSQRISCIKMRRRWTRRWLSRRLLFHQLIYNNNYLFCNWITKTIVRTNENDVWRTCCFSFSLRRTFATNGKSWGFACNSNLFIATKVYSKTSKICTLLAPNGCPQDIRER